MNPFGEQHDQGLDRWSREGARAFASALLESLAPLSVLGAQVLYILEPFLPYPRASVRRLASQLESPPPRADRRGRDSERPE